jgi:glutathione S-transferase
MKAAKEKIVQVVSVLETQLADEKAYLGVRERFTLADLTCMPQIRRFFNLESLSDLAPQFPKLAALYKRVAERKAFVDQVLSVPIE